MDGSAIVVTVMSSRTMNWAAQRMTSGPQDIRAPGRACSSGGRGMVSE
jgi:hypothetical protein